MIKIGIIIFYSGKFPDFLSHFLVSCLNNRQIKWLLFSDQPKPYGCVNNISYKYLDIKTFSKIASEKLGFPVIISNPYKICDFKPAFGKIFEDFLKEYNYWGYSDIDLIFGDITKFITPEFIQDYDIISFYDGFMSGPFCLFKNNEKINNLYKSCPDHKGILQNPVHFAFDENIQRPDIMGISFLKTFHLIKYALQNISSMKEYSYKLTELRYRFQWYFKRKTISVNNPADMTEVVFEALREKKIIAYFNQMIFSDHFFRRIDRNKWTIRWDSGRLIDKDTGKELFAFHFPISKDLENFKIDSYKFENNCFIISESGIKNG